MATMRAPWKWRFVDRSRQLASHDEPLRVLRWWPATLLIVTVVVVGGGLAMWLLGVWSVPRSVTEAEKLRLDRIKTGLTVAAGLAAAVTLLITLRRQVLVERAQCFAENDALEQRSTALYVAAAEQLGSDKAAVRLAGLYALERLGQNDRKLRQTVVEVWCAYLRMPYVPPVEVWRLNSTWAVEFAPADAEALDAKAEAERRQELQVRLTAQRLLATHLDPRNGETTYWLDSDGNHMVIDLVGAVLVKFSLQGEIGRFDAQRAEFHGVTRLSGVQFHGLALLNGVQFRGDADLSTAQFHGEARLSGAQFHGDADLVGAQFHNDADLTGAQLHRGGYLNEAQFHGYADLSRAQFHGATYLRDAHFYGVASLNWAQFHGDADLTGAQFHGDVYLSGTRFRGNASLVGTQFHGDADLTKAKFDGEAVPSGVQADPELKPSDVDLTSEAVPNETQADGEVDLAAVVRMPASRYPIRLALSATPAATPDRDVVSGAGAGGRDGSAS